MLIDPDSPVITLAGWYGGPGSLGFSVGTRDFRKHFKPLEAPLREARHLIIMFPDDAHHIRVRVTESFWSTARRLKSPRIGDWMRRRGDYPWPRGRPPKYPAELITGRGEGMPIVLRLMREGPRP